MQKTITTFAELERYSRAFADGHFEVFLLVGDPGLEKSMKWTPLSRPKSGDPSLLFRQAFMAPTSR